MICRVSEYGSVASPNVPEVGLEVGTPPSLVSDLNYAGSFLGFWKGPEAYMSYSSSSAKCIALLYWYHNGRPAAPLSIVVDPQTTSLCPVSVLKEYYDSILDS